jgi:magnesium-transporting ATPase (P-type)
MEGDVTTAFSSESAQRQKLLLPIIVGGFVAGAFDLIAAFITFGWGVPRAIASGLLGSRAFQGGTATWILGVFLQFFIAVSAAAVYCLASRKLRFLRDHFLVCGLFYGVAIYLVMNLIVLPLSAVPFKVGPFTVAAMRQGLLVHMLIIGLPISASLRRFSK